MVRRLVELKHVIEEIKDYNVVKSWLKDLSANSQLSYLGALAEFCMVNQLKPDEILETIYQEEENRLAAWKRSINKWFEEFDEHCKNQHRTKNTRNIRRTIVNGFVSFHGLPKYSQRGGRRKVEGLKEPNRREFLTLNEIRDLLEACKSFKMKALILTQLSCGLSSTDMLSLNVKDFNDGIIEVYDKITGSNRKICQLKLVRIKTEVEFTTFISEEAVEAIEKYLKLERDGPQPDEPLFTSYEIKNKRMGVAALQVNYRALNDTLKWRHEERGRFRKATSHMMRKFFNTQLINAGMPEEIREHFMGHKYNDKVRSAYYLPSAEELQKVYIQYMECLTISEKPPISMDEFTELKVGFENLENQNKELMEQISEAVEMMKHDVHPDEELMEENKSLRDAYEWTYHENVELKNQMAQIHENFDSTEESPP